MHDDRGSDVAVIATLQDPVRARLYTFVRDQLEPVTRETAAAAAGISAKLAAFHLDKLVAAGLLTAGDARPRPRRPGRTPKVYTPASGEWQVSIPPRRYPLLAEVLVATVSDLGEPARAAVGRVSAETGRRAGERIRGERRLGRLGPARALTVTAEALEASGYEPQRNDTGLTLRNCPFAQLAHESPELVCTLNHGLIAGLLDGLGTASTLQSELVAPVGGCCVQIRSAASRQAANGSSEAM